MIFTVLAVRYVYLLLCVFSLAQCSSRGWQTKECDDTEFSRNTWRRSSPTDTSPTTCHETALEESSVLCN